MLFQKNVCGSEGRRLFEVGLGRHRPDLRSGSKFPTRKNLILDPQYESQWRDRLKRRSLQTKFKSHDVSIGNFPSNTRIFLNLKTQIIFAIFSPNFFKPPRFKFLQIKSPNHMLEVLNLLTVSKKKDIIILWKFYS